MQLLWFAIEMYMLFVFAEVEKFIGNVLISSLCGFYFSRLRFLLTLWGFSQRTGLAARLALHFGVFVAFATIYPSANCFCDHSEMDGSDSRPSTPCNCWLPFLTTLPSSGRVSLPASVLFASVGRTGVNLVENFKRVSRNQNSKSSLNPLRHVAKEDDISESVDPILDKIAKSGIGSLTPSERRTLDRALIVC